MTRSRIATTVLVVAAVGLGASRARADDEPSPALAATITGGAAVVGYGTAVGLAVYTDFEPEALFFSAVAVGMFGPAGGHVYAGTNFGHPLLFAFGRIGFVGLILIGIQDLIAHDDGQTGKANEGFDFALMGTGVVGIVGLTVWETIDSYRCAVKVTQRSSTSVSLAPFLIPARATGGSTSGGLLLSGRF